MNGTAGHSRPTPHRLRWGIAPLLWLLAWGMPAVLSAQSQLINGNRVISGSFNFCIEDNTGTDDTYTCVFTPSLPAYHAGTRYTFKALNPNIGAATLNINSLGAKTIKKWAAGALSDLVTGDIVANQFVDVIYDGTNLLMLSPSSLATVTIASGTLALNTTTVTSGTCGSTQTATATGVVSTDVVQVSFNGDITAITGYTAVTTGTLRIDTYPTTNTVNARVCNGTSSNITPGAVVTLNWRVVR